MSDYKSLSKKVDKLSEKQDLLMDYYIDGLSSVIRCSCTLMLPFHGDNDQGWWKVMKDSRAYEAATSLINLGKWEVYEGKMCEDDRVYTRPNIKYPV